MDHFKLDKTLPIEFCQYFDITENVYWSFIVISPVPPFL